VLYIDWEDVRDEMPAVIAKYGGMDKIYEPIEISDGSFACGYVDDEKSPSCLIGCYLVEKGIPIEDLSGSHTRFLPFWELAEIIMDKIHFAGDAGEALQEIQNYQDFGQSWGYAYDATFQPTKDSE